MYGEHILFSIAVAITIGAIWERKVGYALPVWIIAACAWAPDIDYILQAITHPYLGSTKFFIIHGAFHNVLSLIVFSWVIAYTLSKLKQMDFKAVYLCTAIGYATHLLCDYFVYDTVFHLFYPVHMPVWSCPLIEEFGSFCGIGETKLFMWGFIFIVMSLLIKFHYSESKWIDGFTTVNKEDI